MGFFSTCHQDSGRSTIFGNYIMLCGVKVSAPSGGLMASPAKNNRPVDCPACLRKMGR